MSDHPAGKMHHSDAGLRIFTIAGEASGDALGAALIEGTESLGIKATWRGVAGPAMIGKGAETLFPMDDLSVMGLAEILPRYPALRRRLAETVAEARAWKPDLLLTIDAPEFSLRAARALKPALGVPVVHYVAPSVWAWRPARARRMASFVDHVLALLPFEPPLMEAAGMTCDFVGHPVAAEPRASTAEVDAFRDAQGLGADRTLLLLPGSRGSEVSRLLPIMGATLDRLEPDIRPLVLAAPGVADEVIAAARGWPGRPVILDGRAIATSKKRAAFAAADASLAASGTVSLELAMARTPMVIAYRPARLTWEVMRRMVRLDTVTLVNLVSETRAVPEFLGPTCTPDRLAPAVEALLRGETGDQLAAMELTMTRLGAGGEAPGLRAARSVAGFLDRVRMRRA